MIFPSFRRFCLVDLTSPTKKDALPFYRHEDMLKMMAKHGMAWGIPSWRGNGDFVCVFLLFQELFVIGSIRSTPSLLVPNCEPSLWEYEIVPSGGLIIFIHTHKKGQRALAIARETHRRKFRSQTSDNLDR